jgi:glycosyltransferase involved in cell wall biosynthesis
MSSLSSVTIIVPVYKAERFISNCFDYIAAQTYQGQLDCIFIDDFSPDQSINIISSKIKNYNGSVRFRLIQHNKNLGVSSARNTGIQAASTEFIYFMDVDDRISQDCITILVRASHKYSQADIVAGNIINKKSNLLFHQLPEPLYCDNQKKNLYYSLLFIYTGFAVNKLIRREFVIKHNIMFQVGMKYFEDFLWNINACIYSNAIVYLPNITYSYEYIEDSAMSNAFKNTENIANCQKILIKKGFEINQTIDNCFVETHLFISYYIQELLNNSLSSKSDLKRYAKESRLKIIKQSTYQIRPLLLLFELQLYNPIRSILRWKLFRNRAVKLRLLIYRYAEKYKL